MSGWSKIGWAAVAGVAAAGVIILVLRAQALPEGVRPIVWDKEVCGECAMAVSDPRFAAQLQRSDGVVLNFDDPGCLFQYLANLPARDPEIHAIYLHRAAEGDGWLSAAEVGFVPTKGSPMGYDLGAVPRATPGSISFAEAQERVRQRTEEDHS